MFDALKENELKRNEYMENESLNLYNEFITNNEMTKLMAQL